MAEMGLQSFIKSSLANQRVESDSLRLRFAPTPLATHAQR